jgi:MFS family permease
MENAEAATETRAAAGGARFLRVWGASTMSTLADGLFLIAVPLVALRITTSPALIAGIRVAQTLPWFVFGLFVGVLVDRSDRRRVMVSAELLRGVALLGLGVAAWAGQLHLGLLYGGAFLVGVAEILADTSAQAMVPMVVEPDRLRRANGRIYATQMVMNDFLGAPLGALLVGVGAVAAFVSPAALYLCAGGLLFTMAGQYRVTPVNATRTSVMTDIKEGLRELWGEATLRRLAVFSSVANLANSAFFAVFVVFAVGARSTMHLSAFQFSLLLTAAAVGAVTGSTAADRLGSRMAPRTVLTVAVLALALCFGTPFLIAQPVVVGAALVVSGFSMALASVTNVSMRQEIVPSRLMGRISAGVRLLSFGMQPIGAVLGGLVATLTSPRTLFGVLAGGVLLLVPLTLKIRPIVRKASDT